MKWEVSEVNIRTLSLRPEEQEALYFTPSEHTGSTGVQVVSAARKRRQCKVGTCCQVEEPEDFEVAFGTQPKTRRIFISKVRLGWTEWWSK